jgi:hypothetical protein
MKSKFFWSPIKRSHLASVLGPGSLVRVKNGTTALVGGLSEWETHIPGLSKVSVLDKNAEKDRFLKQFKLRDPELESVLHAEYFVTTQAISTEPNLAKDWFIPIIRFPLAGVCSSNTCRRMMRAEPDDPKNNWCEACVSVKKGKKSRRKILQIPFFFICSAGHIEELDWQKVVHEHCDHSCESSNIKITSGINMRSINAKCIDCPCVFNEIDFKVTCSGQQPWFKGNPRAICTLPMVRVDRTNVLIYQPVIKSSILVPAKDDLNFSLVDWLRNRDGIEDFDETSEKNWQGIIKSIKQLDFEINDVDIRKHMEYVLNERNSVRSDSGIEDWRKREFDVMTSPENLGSKWGQKVLDHEVLDLKDLDPRLFGATGLFSSVTKVNMLTETRVLAGFLRNAAENPDLNYLRDQLWGQNQNRHEWLPAYRGHGEGILFELNPDLIRKWILSLTGDRDTSVTRLSHTLSHLLIAEAAITSGYSLASIRDRVYSLPNSRCGFLIYTAEADEAGTLGGLVELANLNNLETFVRSALQGGQWCTQDPVCINGSGNFQIDLQAGACHQCVLLPETSCEMFNKELDRALIYGCDERRITGIFKS